jgi:hypothetical protein
MIETIRDDTGQIIKKEKLKSWRVIISVLIVLGFFTYIHSVGLSIIKSDTLKDKILIYAILNFLFYTISLGSVRKFDNTKPIKEYFINQETILSTQLILLISAIYIFGIM